MRTCCFAICLSTVLSGSALANSTDVAVLDPVMGYWEGEWSDEISGSQGVIDAKIKARGNGHYAGVLEADVGGQIVPFDLKLHSENMEKPEFTGKFDLGAERGGDADYKFKIEDGKFKGTVSNEQVKVSMTLERVYKKPSSLGAKPPEGAIVLFDGKDFDAWEKVGGGPVAWKIVDGAMQVKPGSGNVISKQKFLDHELHVEFRTPFMPKAIDQARGNSGVYVTGKVEVQVLDCFGEKEPRDNGSGGIYKCAVPRSNACLPPGEWQTYDIAYRAPKGDKPATISVVYNGALIHDNAVIKEGTPGGVGGSLNEAGGLLLQDHGNLVEFRNIWVKPITTEKEKSSDSEKPAADTK